MKWFRAIAMRPKVHRHPCLQNASRRYCKATTTQITIQIITRVTMRVTAARAPTLVSVPITPITTLVAIRLNTRVSDGVLVQVSCSRWPVRSDHFMCEPTRPTARAAVQVQTVPTRPIQTTIGHGWSTWTLRSELERPTLKSRPFRRGRCSSSISKRRRTAGRVPPATCWVRPTTVIPIAPFSTIVSVRSLNRTCSTLSVPLVPTIITVTTRRRAYLRTWGHFWPPTVATWFETVRFWAPLEDALRTAMSH